MTDKSSAGTPRTNAEVGRRLPAQHAHGLLPTVDPLQVVRVDFARQLERETIAQAARIAELEAENDSLKHAAEHWHGKLWSLGEHFDLAVERAEAAEQRLATVEAELSASAHDALRYKWLRGHFRFANDSVFELWFDATLTLPAIADTRSLDEAIDRALAPRAGNEPKAAQASTTDNPVQSPALASGSTRTTPPIPGLPVAAEIRARVEIEHLQNDIRALVRKIHSVGWVQLNFDVQLSPFTLRELTK